jgi:hemolysin III
MLCFVATYTNDLYRIIGVTVFGVTMLLMYLASTLYHAVPHPPVKRAMRIADHCAIYLLIAGTYTPFLIVSMRGFWGWTLFGVLWGAAMMGCIFKMFFTGKFDYLSTAMYVAMGWVAVLAIKPAIEMIPPGALALLVIGGLAYTGGVVFYIWERFPYNHAIWHCFVMTGTAVHFAAVYFFIAKG